MTTQTGSDHVELPALSYNEVKALVDPGTFSRGECYQRRGMISQTRRRGTVLSGVSAGSSGGPYAIRVTLASGGRTKIASAHCTCPIGAYCKHTIALLLTWVANPDDFEIRPTLASLLANQDRDGLVAILEKLADLDPALEQAIERAIPAAPVTVAQAKPGARRRASPSRSRGFASACTPRSIRSRSVWNATTTMTRDRGTTRNRGVAAGVLRTRARRARRFLPKRFRLPNSTSKRAVWPMRSRSSPPW